MLLYRLSSHSAEPEHRDTRTWMPGYRDIRTQGTRTGGHRDRGAPGYRDIRIHGTQGQWDTPTIGRGMCKQSPQPHSCPPLSEEAPLQCLPASGNGSFLE